jgi:LacI family transcriptional regulator
LPKTTIKQVAVEAEVSIATVSRVINKSGFVSAEVKERVCSAISKLNYKRNSIARSLKQGKSSVIGVIVPDISNPYFMKICKGIEDAVGSEGFQLMLCSSDEKSTKENHLLQFLSEKRVGAIAVATSGGNDEYIKGIALDGIPVVLLDRGLYRNSLYKTLDIVAENNTAGAFKLVNCLLEEGYSSIGIINGPINISTHLERYLGVLQALNEWGTEKNIAFYNDSPTVEGGIRAVRHLIKENNGLTAILSLNNRMTLGALSELNQRGLRIPEDMAIASYGEVEAARLLKQPNIYYIDQKPYEVGKGAGDILLRRIQGVDDPAIPVLKTFPNEIKII